MTTTRTDRNTWIAARTAVAEELLRAHAAHPDASADELRREVVADDPIFNAALSHLVAKRRLPQNIYKHVRAAENRTRILSILSLHGGCATDGDSLRQVFNAEDPKLFWAAIDELVQTYAVVRTPERIFMAPDELCLVAVMKELPPAKFTIREIAQTTAARRYSERVGVPTHQAATVVADALERQRSIIRVAEGEYRSRTTVEQALKRIRSVIREYRPYSSDEILTAIGIDAQTSQYILTELERGGELRICGQGLFQPTNEFSGRGWPCCECGTPTKCIEFFHDKPLCIGCRSKLPEKYGCITKTRALREFRLREHELYRLPFMQQPNPHYRRGSPMQLFLLNQVQELARTKWGSDEPYLISLTEVTPDRLQLLEEEPERLRLLTPEQFQLLLADRFEAMGLCVQLIGRANRPDGGIDLIAYPDPHSSQPKYLLAVQAEHHRTARKTGAPKLQKFVGAMSAVPQFRLGFVVTNTTFTWTAEEYAKTQNHFLRLRGFDDLIRWLRNDFANEAEWQEIPEFVEFGGYRVPILKPKPPKLLHDA